MADRYCGNCGHELAEDDRFCPNCGRPVHETAQVPTPEADVPVPPPPQQAGSTAPPPQRQQPREAPPSREIMRPMLVLAGVLFVLGFGELLQGMWSAPEENVGFVLGYGLGQSVRSVLEIAVLTLIACGGVYLFYRFRRGVLRSFGRYSAGRWW